MIFFFQTNEYSPILETEDELKELLFINIKKKGVNSAVS